MPSKPKYTQIRWIIFGSTIFSKITTSLFSKVLDNSLQIATTTVQRNQRKGHTYDRNKSGLNGIATFNVPFVPTTIASDGRFTRLWVISVAVFPFGKMTVALLLSSAPEAFIWPPAITLTGFNPLKHIVANCTV